MRVAVSADVDPRRGELPDFGPIEQRLLANIRRLARPGVAPADESAHHEYRRREAVAAEEGQTVLMNAAEAIVEGDHQGALGEIAPPQKVYSVAQRQHVCSGLTQHLQVSCKHRRRR